MDISKVTTCPVFVPENSATKKVQPEYLCFPGLSNQGVKKIALLLPIYLLSYPVGRKKCATT